MALAKLTSAEDGIEDSDWLSSNDFMMYKFKVFPCSKQHSHDMDTCPYAHPGERTCKRRDPARVAYTSIICVDMMHKGKCPRGRSCTSAHTIYEYWLHPHRYRTEMCKVGPHCTRRICFFAHKPEELRPLPPHLIGSSGGASTGKYSLSATRQAATPLSKKSSRFHHSTTAAMLDQHACNSPLGLTGWGCDMYPLSSVTSAAVSTMCGGHGAGISCASSMVQGLAHCAAVAEGQPGAMSHGMAATDKHVSALWQQQQAAGVNFATHMQRMQLASHAMNASGIIADACGVRLAPAETQLLMPQGTASTHNPFLWQQASTGMADALLQGWLHQPGAPFHLTSSTSTACQLLQQPPQMLPILAASTAPYAPAQSVGIAQALPPGVCRPLALTQEHELPHNLFSSVAGVTGAWQISATESSLGM